MQAIKIYEGGPTGNGRVAPASPKVVAEAAANMLTDIARKNTAHFDRTYMLTGSKSLNFDDIANILTETTGNTYRYYSDGATYF